MPSQDQSRSLDPADYVGGPVVVGSLAGLRLSGAAAAPLMVEWSVVNNPADWLRRNLPEMPPARDPPMYLSAEWSRQYLANLPPDVTPLFGLADVRADAPATDVTPPEPSPVDTVIDRLTRDRVSRSDRGRLGDALGKANDRADGTKAGAGEAFGRIAGR